jgi:hypothetical protein
MGENETEWDEFRTGFVDSLGAEGTVEVALAERSASLLWRLRRLARYEAAKTAVAQEQAAKPCKDAFAVGFEEVKRSGDRAVKVAQEELAGCKTKHERAVAGQTLLVSFKSLPDGECVTGVAARGILDAAYLVNEQTLGVGSSPSYCRDFLTEIGEPVRRFKAVSWTIGHIRRGLAYYAGKADVELAKFLDLLSVELDNLVREGAVAVAQAAAELAQFETRLDHRLARRRAVEAVQLGELTDQLTRYEAHLGRQFQQTLVQLERLQALRTGQFVAPPAVTEVGVTVTKADE